MCFFLTLTLSVKKDFHTSRCNCWWWSEREMEKKEITTQFRNVASKFAQLQGLTRKNFFSISSNKTDKNANLECLKKLVFEFLFSAVFELWWRQQNWVCLFFHSLDSELFSTWFLPRLLAVRVFSWKALLSWHEAINRSQEKSKKRFPSGLRFSTFLPMCWQFIFLSYLSLCSTFQISHFFSLSLFLLMLELRCRLDWCLNMMFFCHWISV